MSREGKAQIVLRNSTHDGNNTEKAEKMADLERELDYVSPKKHRYFCKLYKLDSSINEIPLLIKDMEDYHLLISNQCQKITAFLHDFQHDTSLTSILTSAIQYFQIFTNQNARYLTKIAKNHNCCYDREVNSQGNRCSECQRIISDYRVQQMKEELKLNKFEDHCNFFNVDHLNFTDLNNLRRQSNSIIQSQLFGTDDNQFEYKGGCISLQQYDEVLNLLGSDLHQKNHSIEKIIDYLIKTDKRLVDEGHFKDREAEEEIRRFETIVEGNEIKTRIKDIVKLFFHRYLKMKIYKRKDCEIQVNIKENDIIRELERDKKVLKSKIYQLSTEKQRASIDYENRIKNLQLEMESTSNQFREQLSKANIEAIQLTQKYAEEYHLHDIHKKQLEHLTNEYTNMLALLNRKNINLNSRSRESRTSSTRKSRSSITKKEKYKERTKNLLRRQVSNHADGFNDRGSENSLQEYEKEGSSGKIIQRENLKATQNCTSINELSKFNTYEKIDEKHQEEQQTGETHPHTNGPKRKTSRFKALMNHFNSNTTLQNEINKQKTEQLSSENTSMQRMETVTASHDHPGETSETQPQIRVIRESSRGKNSDESRIEMLLKLFERERSNQQLTLQFPNFLQLYNNFITTISSQNILRRSSSLSNNYKPRDFKPRVSILSTKLERSLQRTSKFIDEESKQNEKFERSAKKQLTNKLGSFKTTSKLEPLQKKGQNFLKKTKNKNTYGFNKNYSKTAEPTLRNDYSNTVSFKEEQIESCIDSSKQMEVNQCALLSAEQIQQLFLNSGNISKFRSEISRAEADLTPKTENQSLMKIYAQLAHMHSKNNRDYEQIKNILNYPREILSHTPVPAQKQNVNQLKLSLKSMIRLHRQCKREKQGVQCIHLLNFMKKLHQIIDQKQALLLNEAALK